MRHQRIESQVISHDDFIVMTPEEEEVLLQILRSIPLSGGDIWRGKLSEIMIRTETGQSWYFKVKIER